MNNIKHIVYLNLIVINSESDIYNLIFIILLIMLCINT